MVLAMAYPMALWPTHGQFSEKQFLKTADYKPKKMAYM